MVEDKIKKELADFVHRIAKDKHKEIKEVIKEYRLGLLLRNELYDNPFDKRIMGILLLQQKRNRIFVQELKKLQRFCVNKKFLVLKGLANAYDLYNNPCIRVAGDIDLLVEEADCADVEKALYQMGYVIKGTPKVGSAVHYYGDLYSEYIKRYKDSFDSYVYNHLILHKEVEGISVEIEIHRYLYGGLIRCPHILYSEIFNTCREVNISSGFSVRTLSCENTLLYMACHMTKHMTSAIKNPEHFAPLIDTKTLLDMRLLLEKYSIDWNQIVEKAKDWEASGSLLLALKMVRYMFSGIVPETVFNHLSGHVMSLSDKKSHESLVYGLSLVDVEKVFDWDFRDFFRREVIDVQERCYYVCNDVSQSDVVMLNCGEIEASLKMHWNEEAIFYDIHHTVADIGFSICIQVCADISRLYTTSLFLRLDGEKIEFVKEHMEKSILEREKLWLQDIRYNREKGDLRIMVPWNRVNIVPKPGNKIPFGFRILVWDANNEFLDSASTPTGNFYNCYGLCSICLVKDR